MKKYWIVLSGLLFSSLIFAANNQTLQPSLVLKQVKMVKQGERLGDDLFFDIAVSRAQKPTQYFRAPKYPLTLPSSKTANVKSVTLWSTPIKNGEIISLTLSLVDQDLNNFNPDDLIGVIHIDLKNENGQLRTQWSMPNQKRPPVAAKVNQEQKFTLSNEHGEYEVYLTLK